MVAYTFVVGVAVLGCLSFARGVARAENIEPSEKETQEYRQELARIMAMDKSFTPGPTNDLGRYEKFVDEIQHKWSKRNKEYYARLMSYACGPLSSGRFNSARQYEVARKYALSVLENPDLIPLTLELELTGHVITRMTGSNAPRGEDFAERRRKNVEVRLHAWKRLIDALDPNWDDDILPGPNSIGAELGLPSGIAPESVKDPALRAKYEAALRENEQKIERHTEQYKLRHWMERFPKSAERYIIQAYSKPPFKDAELKQYLDHYVADETTKARILDTVTKNCDKENAAAQD